MEVYIINLIVATGIAYIVNKKKLNKWLSVILVSIPLIIVSTIRWKVGTDFGNYYFLFNKIQNFSLDLLLGIEYSSAISLERGFSILVWLISKLNNNLQFIMAVLGIINILLIIYQLKKHSKDFPLSVFLYITMMIYYSAFNGVRQWLASGITFLAISFLIERNFWKYLCYIILASTIHFSALIMIPIYFIVNAKPFSKKIIMIVFIAIILLFGLEKFLGSFTGYFEGTKYQDYTIISDQDDGVNIFRVFVAFVPIVLSYILYNGLKEENENAFLINLSLINFLILMMATRSTIIARFNMYFEVYNLLLYPKIIKLIKRKERYLFLFIILLCFFIYMCLLLQTDSNLLPYRTIFEK